MKINAALSLLAFLLSVVLVSGPALCAEQAPVPKIVATTTSPKIELNKATRDELESVPGIGPKTAQAIIDLRTKKGAFARIEDLLEVRGIGEKNLKKLAPYLLVQQTASPAPVPPSGAK